MTVFLVRHGESAGNAAGVLSGATDHPLTERGRRQAVAAAERFAGMRIAALFTSTLSRAIETAALIVEHAPCAVDRILRHQDLDERHFGALEGAGNPDPAGLTLDHPVRRTCTDVDHRPAGGESIREAQARAMRFYTTTIAPAAAAGDVLVVTHGNIIKGLIAWHLGWPVELVPEIPMHNCLVTRLP